MKKENVPWTVADLKRNAREAEAKVLGWGCGCGCGWRWRWGWCRALSAVSCLMDISGGAGAEGGSGSEGTGYTVAGRSV